MPGRHAASLLPKDAHNPALLKLMRSSLTDDIVEHVARKAMSVIRCRDNEPSSPAESSSSRGEIPLPTLDDFIRDICRKSRCHVPTLLCTLVYLDRLKERLPVRSCGSPSTRHRVFVAALIVAAKYLNDSSPYNKHWVRYAGHFRLEEVNLMERQLLCLLDFDLRIGEPELIEAFAPFLGPIEAGMAERLLRRQSRPQAQAQRGASGHSDSDSDEDSDDVDVSECEMNSDVDEDTQSSAPSSTISPASSSLVVKTQEIQISTHDAIGGSSASSESSYSPHETCSSPSSSNDDASRPVSWSSNRSASTTASSLDYSCGSSSPIDSPPTTPRDTLEVPKLPLSTATGGDLLQHLQRKFDVQQWMYGGAGSKRNAVVIDGRGVDTP